MSAPVRADRSQRAPKRPPSQPAGEPLFSVIATCPGTPACTGWGAVRLEITDAIGPRVERNSVRAVTTPLGQTLTWQIESGTGSFHVHRTDQRTDLLELYNLPLTVAGTAPTPTWDDTATPPAGGVLYYQVFGVSVCTGQSMAP